MAGAIRGSRYIEPDPDDPNQVLGATIRELRIQRGLSFAAVATAMRQAGHEWSRDTVGRVQAGRVLRPEELRSLAKVLDVSIDELVGSDSKPLPDRPDGVLRLSDDVVKWVGDQPPFQAWEGQREDIEKLAAAFGVSRSEMCRRLWASAIPAYRRYLDRQERDA